MIKEMDKHKIVKNAYQEIICKGILDVVKGNKFINKILNEKMASVPSLANEYINNKGKGCCFIFAAYMINILKDAGITCYMVATNENIGLRAAVLYNINGKWFVANPVDDIEYFTENKIIGNDRLKYYVKDTNIFTETGKDKSRYSLEEYVSTYGSILMIGHMYNTNDTTLRKALGSTINRVLIDENKNHLSINK